MPKSKVRIILEVNAYYKKGTDLHKLLEKHTEWIGEPKNNEGCVNEIKFVRIYSNDNNIQLKAYKALWKDTENGLMVKNFFKHRETFRMIVNNAT